MRSPKTGSNIYRRCVVQKIDTIHKFLDPQDGAAALAYGLVVDHRPSRLTFSKPVYGIFFTMSQYDSLLLSYGIFETQARGTLLFRTWAGLLKPFMTVWGLHVQRLALDEHFHHRGYQILAFIEQYRAAAGSELIYSELFYEGSLVNAPNMGDCPATQRAVK